MKQGELPKVYFTKNIVPENLIKLYEKLGRKLEGKVGVKIHSGEHNKGHIIQPEFMKPLVDYVKGTIIEANTTYGGRREKTEDHWKVIEERGFKKYFTVDILDEEGEMELPVAKPKQIKVDYVGKHLANYDSLLILSHFKGHMMAGFGGALKNVAIGIASSHGKAYIHGAGHPEKKWSTADDLFHESMADANQAVMNYRKGKMVYINVMKDMSIDCDCDANPKDPEMADIGMLASLDPVALDQACLDLVYNSPDKGKESLIKRIEEKHAVHLLETAEEEGLGSRKYELVNIDA